MKEDDVGTVDLQRRGEFKRRAAHEKPNQEDGFP